MADGAITLKIIRCCCAIIIIEMDASDIHYCCYDIAITRASIRAIVIMILSCLLRD